MHSKKAQTSFEVIFIATAIIIVATLVVGQFNLIRNSTVAMGLVKTSTLSALQASSQKDFLVKRISIASEDTSTGTINFQIDTEPDSGIDCIDIGADNTKTLIKEKGLYQTVGIVVNTTLCP